MKQSRNILKLIGIDAATFIVLSVFPSPALSEDEIYCSPEQAISTYIDGYLEQPRNDYTFANADGNFQDISALREQVEKQIDEVGGLIKAGRYRDADKLLSQIERDYPSLVNLGVCGASERSATDYRVTLDQKLRKPGDIGQESFYLDGVVTMKSPQEGSGSFWRFVLMAKDGVEYNFLCCATCPLRFQVEDSSVDSVKGYELLKNTYPNVRLIFPKSQYNYVMKQCRNKGCENGACPSIIIMLPALSTPGNENEFKERLVDKPLTDFFPLIESAIKNGEKSKLNIYWIMMQKAYDREEKNNGFVCQNSLGWYKYWDSCARFVLGYYNNCPKESGVVSEVGHEVSGNRDDNWIKLNDKCFTGGQHTIIYSESSNEILRGESYGYDYTKIIAKGDKITILYDIPSGYTNENVRTLTIILTI